MLFVRIFSNLFLRNIHVHQGFGHAIQEIVCSIGVIEHAADLLAMFAQDNGESIPKG